MAGILGMAAVAAYLVIPCISYDPEPEKLKKTKSVSYEKFRKKS